MAKIAAELLVERLIDWRVDTVFGLPGDGINGLMEGFRRHQDKITFVLVPSSLSRSRPTNYFHFFDIRHLQ